MSTTIRSIRSGTARVRPVRPLHLPVRGRATTPAYPGRLPLEPSPSDRDVLGGPKRWYLEVRHHLAELPDDPELGASWTPEPCPPRQRGAR